MKKVFIMDKYHHKNQFFLDYLVKNHFQRVGSVENADIIFSAATYIHIQNYPDKKFILGPHFSVFPEKKVKQFNNRENNGTYIQPSEWSKSVWTDEFSFKNLPVKSMSFGVDTKRFAPDDKMPKDTVILYHKNRDPSDFKIIQDFLKYKNIKFVIFDYHKRY